MLAQPSPHNAANRAIHAIIPFAFANGLDEALARQALRLPHLQALTGALTETAWLHADELTPTLPHERLLTRWLGFRPQNASTAPMAALHAARHGFWKRGDAQSHTMQTAGWAFITPCHWHVTTDRILLQDPAQLHLEEAEARSLFSALRQWFAQDGITLLWDSPARWLAHAPLFTDLTTASLERAINRDLRQWLPTVAQAPLLQRLQTECQMLFHQLPQYDERSARGLLPVNAFWVSGTGALAGAPAGWQNRLAQCLIVDALREPALQSDWQAWLNAWEQLDRTLLADLLRQRQAGRAVTLSLAGEQHALSLQAAPQAGAWNKLRNSWRSLRKPDVTQLLRRL